jgi:hypothetical protein
VLYRETLDERRPSASSSIANLAPGLSIVAGVWSRWSAPDETVGASACRWAIPTYPPTERKRCAEQKLECIVARDKPPIGGRTLVQIRRIFSTLPRGNIKLQNEQSRRDIIVLIVAAKSVYLAEPKIKPPNVDIQQLLWLSAWLRL